MSATTHLMASADHTACGRLLTARLSGDLYFNHSMVVVVVMPQSVGRVTCSRCRRQYSALKELAENGSQTPPASDGEVRREHGERERPNSKGHGE